MKAIPLTRGFAAIVDEADYDRLIKYKWCALIQRGGNVYAVRSSSRATGHKHIYMHRVILGAEPGKIIDHINRDTVDNRRENLRLCSHKENAWNSKGWKKRRFLFKGITAFRNGKYRARIKINGRSINLGTFATQEEAGAAYEAVAKTHHGRFFQASQWTDGS